MTFHRDDSKAPNDVERYYSLTTCDGGVNDIALEVPQHWHKYHDEHMSCIEGQIELSLEGSILTAKPGDPAIIIPRRAVHGFKFPKGQRAVLKEMTDPTGEFKQMFFEDVFGSGRGSFFGAMRAFADGDTYIKMPGPWRWVDEVWMFVMWALVKVLRSREGEVPRSMPSLGGQKKEL